MQHWLMKPRLVTGWYVNPTLTIAQPSIKFAEKQVKD